MLTKQMTMIIMSCDKYSALWDGHLKLLKQNWSDCRLETMLVTDKPTTRAFDDISVVVAEGREWSDRLRFALERVKTEYVFLTLDDYFMIKRASIEKLNALLSIMSKDRYDYVRLYLYPKCPQKARIPQYGKFYVIEPSSRYSVNLFPGIWRKSLLLKTLESSKNIWQYEITLPAVVSKIGGRCALSVNGEISFVDVIRQGKIQRKALGMLRKNQIALTDWPIHSIINEVMYGGRVWIMRLIPRRLRKTVRFVAIKMGMRVIGPEVGEEKQ